MSDDKTTDRKADAKYGNKSQKTGTPPKDAVSVDANQRRYITLLGEPKLNPVGKRIRLEEDGTFFDKSGSSPPKGEESAREGGAS